MMDTAYAQCSIHQMRRELRIMLGDLDALEMLVNDTSFASCCGTNVKGIAANVNELKECRKYFNRAFRYLLDELATAAQDEARNQHVDFDADFAKAHPDA